MIGGVTALAGGATFDASLAIACASVLLLLGLLYVAIMTPMAYRDFREKRFPMPIPRDLIEFMIGRELAEKEAAREARVAAKRAAAIESADAPRP